MNVKILDNIQTGIKKSTTKVSWLYKNSKGKSKHVKYFRDMLYISENTYIIKYKIVYNRQNIIGAPKMRNNYGDNQLFIIPILR